MLKTTDWSKFFAVVGLIFCFLGTLYMIIDNVDSTHKFFDNHQKKWSNINLAIEKLQRDDQIMFYNEGKARLPYGYIQQGDLGFEEIVKMIKQNYNKEIDIKQVWLMSGALSIGIEHFKTIAIVRQDSNKLITLCSEEEFYGWVGNYRNKYFLKIGIILVILGSFFQLISITIKPIKRLLRLLSNHVLKIIRE